MVVKSRSATRVHVWTQYREPDTYENTASYPLDITDKIEYDDGPQYLNGHVKWKRCVHQGLQELEGACRITNWWIGRYSSPKRWNMRNLAGGTSANSYKSGFGNLISSLPEVDLTDLKEKFRTELSGNLESNVLPITDLYQLFRKGKLIRNLADQGKVFYDLFHPKNIKDLVKKASNAHLVWKFGVVPFTRDALNIMNLASTVDAHLQKLRAKTTSASDSWAVASTQDNSKWESAEGSISLYNGQIFYKDLYERYVGARMFFRARLTYNTSDAVRTSLLWDATGFRNIASTAWDLIPWSFVIDWFVSVGDFLSELETYYFHNTPLEKVEELRDVWVCTTQKLVKERTLTRISNQGGGSYSGTALGGFKYIRFTREPFNTVDVNGIISGLGSLRTGTPSTSQGVSGLELLLQRTL